MCDSALMNCSTFFERMVGRGARPIIIVVVGVDLQSFKVCPS